MRLLGLDAPFVGLGEVRTYEEAYDPCLNYSEVGGENGVPGHGYR